MVADFTTHVYGTAYTFTRGRTIPSTFVLLDHFCHKKPKSVLLLHLLLLVVSAPPRDVYLYSVPGRVNFRLRLFLDCDTHTVLLVEAMLAFCSLSLGFASMPDLGEVHYDLSFGDDPLQTLDLYKTSAAAEGMPPVPCIMFVHGGGWSGGDKRTNENPPEWLLSLRQHGYHVASTNYRLAPAHGNPAQIDDVERCAPL